PLQGLHAAQAAADHRGPLLDAQQVGQARLAVHPVLHGHHGEIGAVGLAGRRIDAGRPGGAVAAAQVVERHHEEAVGVDGLARTDATVPPARLAIVGAVVAGSMVMAGQGVADQHRVAARGVELTVGFIDQLVIGQFAATGQRQRLAEGGNAGFDQTHGIFGKDRRHRTRLMRKGDGTVYCVPPCNSPMVSAMRAGGCRPASAPQRLASTGLAVSGRNQFISRAQMPPVATPDSSTLRRPAGRWARNSGTWEKPRPRASDTEMISSARRSSWIPARMLMPAAATAPNITSAAPPSTGSGTACSTPATAGNR